MIIAIEGKGTTIGGSIKDIITQAFLAIDKACENADVSDEERFRLAVPMIFGPERLHKLVNSSELNSHVNPMLDELWNAVKMIEQYVDNYKATEDNSASTENTAE